MQGLRLRISGPLGLLKLGKQRRMKQALRRRNTTAYAADQATRDAVRSGSPGYPLESPGLALGCAATFCYTFGAVMIYNDTVFPEPLREAIYSIFRSHQNIVSIGIVAVVIHLAYTAFAVDLSRKRGYDAKATTWWAFQCFAFGFVGVKLLLDQGKAQT